MLSEALGEALSAAAAIGEAHELGEDLSAAAAIGEAHELGEALGAELAADRGANFEVLPGEPAIGALASSWCSRVGRGMALGEAASSAAPRRGRSPPGRSRARRRQGRLADGW